jgi:hypothetical protein
MKLSISALLIIFSAFFLTGNEKIADLTRKSDFPLKRFFLKDQAGNRTYGSYEINQITFDVFDHTIKPFNGKVDINTIKEMGISYCIFSPCLAWSVISLAAGTLAAGIEYSLYISSFFHPEIYQSGTDPAQALDLNRRFALIIGSIGSGVLVLGIILLGVAAYYGNKYYKLKKKIVNLLNSDGVSILETKNIRLSLAFDITAKN